MSRVVHFEIHATDPEALIPFYQALFGWTFQKWDGPMPYWMIRTGEPGERGIDGGLIPRPCPVAAPGQDASAFVCTVNVASAEASLAHAVELGAKIAVPVMAVPTVGWLCYAVDPDGNVFGMMQMDPTAV